MIPLVTEEIIEMLKTRSNLGFEKYGTTMDRTDLKGSDWCQHAIEELLDGAQYLLKVKKDFELLEAIERDKQQREVLND